MTASRLENRASEGAVAHHRSYAPARVGCFVLTASDSRTPENDGGGAMIAACLERAGHRVLECQIVADEVETLRRTVREAAAREDVDAVLVTGGTGFAPRDVTPEALEPLFERRLDGFGELFRVLSFDQIGAAAMLSRAVAGTVGRALVFAMPGSPAAVELAMERLVVPELTHLVGQLRRPDHRAT